MSKLQKRIITGICYLVAVLSMVIVQNELLQSLFVGTIMVLGILEYFSCVNLEKTYMRTLGIILALVSVVSYQILQDTAFNYIAGATIIIISILNIINIFLGMKYTISEISIATLGYIYNILFPIYILRIGALNDGNIKLGLLFAITISTDTFAWLIGSYFGKHKFTKISPNKTIEGAIGGIVGAVIVVVLYKLIVSKITGVIITPDYLYLILGTIFLSIVSQIGDLFASAIKRSFGKKDFGKILNEHGGILDRVDSIIFTAPIAYYLFTINLLI